MNGGGVALISTRAGRITALLAVTAIAVGACSSGSGSSPSASAAASAAAPSAAASEAPSASAAASAAASGSGSLKVTFIPKQINNPYFDAAKVGADKAAGELGGTVTQVGPSSATEAQASFIQDATTQGVSAIAISANDPNAVVPALTAAKAAGIKVVGYDSSPAAGAYDVFVNQTDFSLIGQSMADWACDLAPSCTGEIAILSAAATASNQNAWIDNMKTVLKGDKYKNLKLVDTVYGDDDPQKSTTQAQGLLQTHPNLKVIIAPTTVGILAAAQVVSGQKKQDSVKVTGLGFPKQMAAYVKDGTAPEFGLWSVPDLGYLTMYVADALVKGTITGKQGETLTVPNLNDGKPYTIGANSTIILGPPLTFNKDNIDAQNWGPS
jgi:rhamnose transport system substrate-binding protein